MQIEMNVKAYFGGREDIPTKVTARRQHSGLTAFAVELSDDGMPDVIFELDAEQTKALSVVLAFVEEVRAI